MQTKRIGIIGCGAISSAYLENATKRFPMLEVVACADLIPERAREQAEKFGVPTVCTTEELLDDPNVDIVLNLTIPAVHDEINRRALSAGKHVYVEKPLALDLSEAESTVALAKDAGLRIGCAPDTFLGAGIQTCRSLIDKGEIGEPVAATALWAGHGHESWHPDPEFYYKKGGGPMLDMGPYYLTALINLLGPIQRITGEAKTTFTERLITSKPKYGKRIEVETPTHLTGVATFESGATATIMVSFDIWKHNLPRIEIHGTEGSLSVPDPNGFAGPVRLYRNGDDDWREVPTDRFSYAYNARTLGLADMAQAIISERPHRASGEVAFHVLESMLAFEKSSVSGKAVEIASTCDRPEPLAEQLPDGSVGK